jgi:hypothetical protein
MYTCVPVAGEGRGATILIVNFIILAYVIDLFNVNVFLEKLPVQRFLHRSPLRGGTSHRGIEAARDRKYGKWMKFYEFTPQEGLPGRGDEPGAARRGGAR